MERQVGFLMRVAMQRHTSIFISLIPHNLTQTQFAVVAKLAEVGIDMEDVEQTLEDEGVHSFSKSFDELLQSLTDKAATFKNA